MQYHYLLVMGKEKKDPIDIAKCHSTLCTLASFRLGVPALECGDVL